MSANIENILIVGGGIVGLALARALAPYFPVTLIDKSHLQESIEPRDAPSNLNSRVYALNLASLKLLQKIGAPLKAEHCGPYEKMCVWDASGCGSDLIFDAAVIGYQHLGVIVEEHHIRNALLDNFPANIQLVQGIPSAICHTKNDVAIQLQLEDETVLKGALLIGADGQHSWVRDHCFGSAPKNQYGHTAIVATVRASSLHHQTAYQRFNESGPLAFLPLLEPNLYSIVWSCIEERAKELLQMDENTFARALYLESEGRLGKFECVGQRKSFVLSSSHVPEYVTSRCALVGDAAHQFHPLAGQGLNAGLMDVAVLFDTLQDLRQRGRDIGLKVNLVQYSLYQHAVNDRLIKLMALFKNGFESKIPLVQKLRNHAFGAVNRSTLLQKFFVQEASGVGSHLSLHQS